jgi:hypothetical protein
MPRTHWQTFVDGFTWEWGLHPWFQFAVVAYVGIAAIVPVFYLFPWLKDYMPDLGAMAYGPLA